MAILRKYSSLAVTLIIGVLIQGIFILADKNETPNKAAVEFFKAYYLMDTETMSDHLCKSFTSQGFVDRYKYAMENQAEARGYETSYLKNRLYHVRTEVLGNNGSAATVRLTAGQRKSINIVFEYIGLIFGLLDKSEVDQTVNLVKEGESWKVCAGSIAL